MSDEQEPPKEKKELDVGSQFYHERIRAGLQSMDQAAADIARGTEENYRRVPEPYFIAQLLPIMRKWLINNPNDPAEPGLWFNVSGGLHNPIYVIGPDQEVLYQTPQLFVPIPDRDPMKDHQNLDSVHQMVSIQGQMMDNSDRRASYAMENEIVNTLMPRAELDAKTKNILLAIAIYKRYNLPMTEILGEDIVNELKPALEKLSGPKVPDKPQSVGNDEDEAFIFDED